MSDAVLAVVAALAGFSAGSVAQLVAARLKDKSERLERCRERLTKLYDPIWVLTNYTERLQLTIGGRDPDWRLLDSIEEVVADPASAIIAQEIVAANGRTAAAIFEFAGLTRDGSVPDCFLDFLSHAAVVRAAVESGKSPRPENRPHYPKALDKYVENHVALLKRELGLKDDDMMLNEEGGS